MNRPYLSQCATVADYKAALAEYLKNLNEFSAKVGERVEEQYDLEDGGSLCYNLVESGVITLQTSVDEAARIVAQHIEQA